MYRQDAMMTLAFYLSLVKPWIPQKVLKFAEFVYFLTPVG